MDFAGRSAKAQMRTANRLAAGVCLLMGGNELAAGTVTIKDMAEGRQWSVPRGQAAEELRGWSDGRSTPDVPRRLAAAGGLPGHARGQVWGG